MKYKFLSLLEMLMIAILISGLSPVNAFDGRDDDSRLKASDTLATATFAGGCFWCMEPPFEALEGVTEVRSGYTGGSMPDPTYNEVASGRSGHLEAIQVRYDPAVISFADLLAVFWQQIDPTDAGGSFVDRGPQYRSAIFYHTESQKQLAEASRRALDESGRFDRPVATEILPVERFYPAEDYHQDYHKTQPLRYKAYRAGSGRDRYIARVWQDDPPPPVCPRPLADTRPDDEELEKRLSPLQYEVTRENGTEPPFRNAYWDNKKPGLYVDVISGEPLFTSADKFDSGTGWPSFTKPVTPEAVVEKTDQSLLMTRTEVRSRQADSHLGHVFTDGPEPTGLRYCINSAALRFIPLEDLEKEGYGEFKKQFETE